MAALLVTRIVGAPTKTPTELGLGVGTLGCKLASLKTALRKEGETGEGT